MATSIDIIIPVYNEEQDLPGSIATLHGYLQENLPYDWRIIVADNGSTDSTLAVAQELSQRFPKVEVLHLDQKGRGRALRRAMLEGKADIAVYMDVDLSTDLKALPPLVDAIANEGYDICIGSRLMKGAQVERAFKREFISRSYNLLVKSMFFTRFKDAQCGFKALSRRAIQDLVPLVQDQGWFFDSEMLILAEKNSYRIKEIPVRWIDDPDSRVNVIRTASGDIKGLLRLRFGGLRKASRSLNAKPSDT